MNHTYLGHIRSGGFTLTELAVVLVIVALLIGGLLMPLSAQDELRRTAETQKTLRDINDALLGFAVANGRLPCPATVASNGQEAFLAGYVEPEKEGVCSNFYDGFVPAAALGLGPVNEHGLITDGWNQPIRYAVFNGKINDIEYPFTRTNGMDKDHATMEKVAVSTMLSVCTTATGITNIDCGTATKLTNKTPALIFSEGKPDTATGSDAVANRNGDIVFVSHTPTPAAAANGEFDDIVLWLSPNILFNKMIAAGRLP